MRAALIIGVLALLFAPGAPVEPADVSPEVLVGSVLAPTTLTDDGSTPATPREHDLLLAAALLAVLATAAAMHATCRAPSEPAGAGTDTSPSRRPPRRGPPTLAR